MADADPHDRPSAAAPSADGRPTRTTTYATDDVPPTARVVWSLMSDLVLDHGRRRDVTEATGMSFGKTRALRRITRGPLSLRELATALGIDPPNATVVVDELEGLGLVTRGPHPTDRRIKLVSLTPKGRALADEADAILSTPPPGLAALAPDDLETLQRLLSQAGAA